MTDQESISNLLYEFVANFGDLRFGPIKENAFRKQLGCLLQEVRNKAFDKASEAVLDTEIEEATGSHMIRYYSQGGDAAATRRACAEAVLKLKETE